MRKEKAELVKDWMMDPITQQFMATLAARTHECRESSLSDAIASGGGVRSAQYAAQCESLRWAMTEAVKIISENGEFESHVSNHTREPEEGYAKKGGTES